MNDLTRAMENRGRRRGNTSSTQSFVKTVRKVLARGPATSADIAKATGIAAYTVYARMKPLARDGVVSFDYVRVGGRRACEWRLNESAEPFVWVPA